MVFELTRFESDIIATRSSIRQPLEHANHASRLNLHRFTITILCIHCPSLERKSAKLKFNTHREWLTRFRLEASHQALNETSTTCHLNGCDFFCVEKGSIWCALLSSLLSHRLNCHQRLLRWVFENVAALFRFMEFQWDSQSTRFQCTFGSNRNLWPAIEEIAGRTFTESQSFRDLTWRCFDLIKTHRNANICIDWWASPWLSTETKDFSGPSPYRPLHSDNNDVSH